MPTKLSKPIKRNAEHDAQRERLRKDMAHKAELGRLAQAALEELEGEEKEAPVEVEAEAKAVKCDDGMYAMPTKAYGGATSLKAALAATEAGEQLEAIAARVEMYKAIVENIMADGALADKGAAIADAAGELKKMMGAKKELPVEVKAWATFAEGGKFCVYKVGADGEKTGESIECYESRGEGNAKVEELYGKALKAGARHNSTDQAELDAAHNAIVKAGANCGMKMLKGADGSYRWFGWASNKFRDRDTAKHPLGEIITDAAHKEFIEYLNANPDKAPEWWTWHTPVRKSRADWWDYADGYLLMSGPASEEDAKGYLDTNEPIAMSHGFHTLKRDSAKGLIQSYRSFEVSDLPPDAAANPYTNFEMVRKELAMLTKEKRDYLVKRLGEDRVKVIEQDTAQMSKALEDAGVEWKETQVPAPTPAVPNPADTEQAIAALKELFNVEGLNTVLAQLQESNKALTAKLDAQANELQALKKSQDEKLAEAIAPKVKPIKWGYQASEAKENIVQPGDPLAAAAPENWINQAFGNLANAQKPA